MSYVKASDQGGASSYQAEVNVIAVQDEGDLWEFLRLPWRIYQHDPCWVPPLLPHLRSILDPQQGPFFENGEAQYFLAFYRGKPAGRISAHVNRLYDAFHDRLTGFFGFFECIREPKVAAALFRAASGWLRERGKTRLLGPLSFSVYDEVGMLVKGFDSPPVLFESHNPPYYPELMVGLDFRKSFDFHALRVTERQIDLAAMDREIAEILQDQHLRLERFNPRDLLRRRDEVFALFNDAWSSNWGHVPFTARQFQTFFEDLKLLLRPNMVHFLLNQDRMVGFTIVVPDLNPLIKKLHGRLTWRGKLRLLYEARYKPLKRARCLVVGVQQRYQRKRLHRALILKSYADMVRETPCDFWDLSLVPENILFYLRFLKSYGAESYKIFRIFEKEI